MPNSYPELYFPILVQAFIAMGLAAALITISYVFGKRVRNRVKDMPYESGMDPIADARQPFDVKYSLVAILFLIFDVELLFLYPWAVSAFSEPDGVPKSYRGDVFWVMIVFVVTLVVSWIIILAVQRIPLGARLIGARPPSVGSLNPGTA